MISNAAGIMELVRYITRGYESLARPQSEDLISDGGLQFAGVDEICLILTRMCVARHTLPRRDSQIEKAVCSTGIFAGQKYGTESDVEVITLRLRLIFNRASDPRYGLNVRHDLTPPLAYVLQPCGLLLAASVV